VNCRRREEDLRSQHVDGYSFIWKDLKSSGYVTQWAEEGAEIGTFTYSLVGFKKARVDHYFRTLFMAEQNYHNTKHLDYCLGSLPRHLLFLDAVKDFVDAYSSQRKFSFGFHSEYTHYGSSELQLVDDDLLLFLKYLKTQGHLEKAILILMSDHGVRLQV